MEESIKELPRNLPAIQLTHGRAMWVLVRLGFRGLATESTFHEYLKSLRKLGIPFARGDIGLARRGVANYSYCHLMELALALTLRVYHVVPDSVLSGIIRYRQSFYSQYRRAYRERNKRMGSSIVIETNGQPPIHMRGVFLDLGINFSGGRLVKFGPPKALSPFEALELFAQRDLAARALLPINLSLLAEKIVMFSLRAPVIRRGPSPAAKQRRS
jgi:hypothetical protein